VDQVCPRLGFRVWEMGNEKWAGLSLFFRTMRLIPSDSGHEWIRANRLDCAFISDSFR
jgi:hypothetical protein